MAIKPADVIGAAMPLVSPLGVALVNLVSLAIPKKDGEDVVDPKVLVNAVSTIAKELAIARRIEISEEVTYTERYGKGGSGKAEVAVGAAEVAGSIGGGGNSISERVFTFKGFSDTPQDGSIQEVLQQLLGPLPGVLTNEKIEIKETVEEAAPDKAPEEIEGETPPQIENAKKAPKAVAKRPRAKKDISEYNKLLEE